MPEGSYDLVIIGAGPGGYVAAIRAGQLGLSTCVIERDSSPGGTCLLRGCIPTKALLHTADLLQHAREAERFGVTCSEVRLDIRAAHEHKRKVVLKNTKGVEFLFRKNKVDLLHGTGKLLGGGKVEVAGAEGERRTIAAKHIILATGSRCGDLPHVQADGDRIINSDHALELEEVPGSLLVLGAGAVGMEFASIFARFGTKVTVVELLDRVLPLEDPDVSKEVERAFKKQGIATHTSTTLEEVRTSEGKVTCRAKDKGGQELTFEAERLLVAVGRKAVTESLGLESTGVKVERGRVMVDERYRTGEANVYAIGDLIDTPWLAHVASMEGIVVVERLAGQDPPSINYRHVPACTYCWPEVGSIGFTEPQAREAGYDVRTGSFPFSAIGKAAIIGDTTGFVKIVGETKYDELLGVHIVGPHATELIAEAEAALRGELTVEELVRTIHAHPTLHEAVHEAAEAVSGAAIHI
jgi:dihydrolipoamide dehydrogenase